MHLFLFLYFFLQQENVNVEELILSLRATDKEYRLAAARQLEQIGKPCLEQLISALENNFSPSATYIESLVADLASDSFETRESATKKLSELGNQVIEQLEKLEQLSDDLEQKERIKIIIKTIQKYRKQNEELDTIARIHICKLIAKFADDRCVGPVLNLIENSTDRRVRKSALSTLKIIKGLLDQDAQKRLINRAEWLLVDVDFDWKERVLLSRILQDYEIEATYELGLKLLDTEQNLFVSSLWIEFLCKTKKKRYLKLIVDKLYSEDTFIRSLITNNLKKLYDTDDIDQIIKQADER